MSSKPSVQPNAESNSSNPVVHLTKAATYGVKISSQITVNHDGIQIIPGSLDDEQFHWLGEVRGIVYENCHSGYYYAIKKPPAILPPANLQEACCTCSGMNPEHYCDVLQQQSFNRKLSLPGVSVSHLLAREPNILLNADMLISNLSSIGMSCYSDTLTIKVKIEGCSRAMQNSIIQLECSHWILQADIGMLCMQLWMLDV
ncbi:hypothetical protein EDD18DRAFT_1110511 [Armillaria luteobubalina]|uniref:Uncharacterized protein n=1 Tax=Armillaria luteobubalina TaxID=153913 RepID=A0AA39PPK8_9AGAR|nr:hypothetical protein EDD18DRAFT_1110511 [Armillaria luteobubalina]